MLHKVIIDGKEYEVGRNFDIAKQIAGNYGEYSLGATSDGFYTTIKFRSNNYFERDKIRNIGQLIYDNDTDIITYKKYIDADKHIMHINNSIGLNYDIIKNLAVKDKIKIIERTEKETIYRNISVRKALTYQDFKQFKNQGFEKQIFIPIEDFKTTTVKVKKRCKKK